MSHKPEPEILYPLLCDLALCTGSHPFNVFDRLKTIVPDLQTVEYRKRLHEYARYVRQQHTHFIPSDASEWIRNGS